MSTKFKPNPEIEIEAMELTHKNIEEIQKWMGDAYTGHSMTGKEQTISMPVESLSGISMAVEGDWIVKGDGEFYPVKPAVMKKKYIES